MRGWAECICQVQGGGEELDERLVQAIESTDGAVFFHLDPSYELDRVVLTWAGPGDVVRLAAFRCLKAIKEIEGRKISVSITFSSLWDTQLESCEAWLSKLEGQLTNSLQLNAETLTEAPPPVLKAANSEKPRVFLSGGHRWFELEFVLEGCSDPTLITLKEQLNRGDGEDKGTVWIFDTVQDERKVLIARLLEVSELTLSEIIFSVQQILDDTDGEVMEVTPIGMLPRSDIFEASERSFFGAASLEERSLEDSIERSGEANFASKVASTVPAPGGGAVAARVGVYAVSLALKAINISLKKKLEEADQSELETIANRLDELGGEFYTLENEDQEAFLALLEAWRLSKNKDSGVSVEEATLRAIEAPLQTIEKSIELIQQLDAITQLAKKGIVRAESDVAVALELANSAIESSGWNVKVNLPSLEKGSEAEQEVLDRWDKLKGESKAVCEDLRTQLNDIISGS